MMLPPSSLSRDVLHKVFIGGLSFDTSDESLEAYFSRFGEIATACVMRDPDLNRSRGFGFVTFKTPEGAAEAIKATHHIVDGRKVESKMAIPRHRPNTPSSVPSRGAGSPSLFIGEDFGSPLPAQLLSHPGMTPALPLQHRSTLSEPELMSNKIFVGGLKYTTTEDGLKRFFEQTFGEVESAQVIFNRDTKKSRGFGFVIFVNQRSVEIVLSRQIQTPIMVEGKQVEVKPCVARQTPTLPPISSQVMDSSYQPYWPTPPKNSQQVFPPLSSSSPYLVSQPPEYGASRLLFRSQSPAVSLSSNQFRAMNNNPDLGLFDMSGMEEFTQPSPFPPVSKTNNSVGFRPTSAASNSLSFTSTQTTPQRPTNNGELPRTPLLEGRTTGTPLLSFSAYGTGPQTIW